MSSALFKFLCISLNRELKEMMETEVPLVAKEKKERRHVSMMCIANIIILCKGYV